jgi:acetyl-CoA acetyltransferase
MSVPRRHRTRTQRARSLRPPRSEAARTPIGRGYRTRGWFRDTHPNELLGTAYTAVIERAGIEPKLVENVGHAGHVL